MQARENSPYSYSTTHPRLYLEQLKKAGFKSVTFNGEKYELKEEDTNKEAAQTVGENQTYTCGIVGADKSGYKNVSFGHLQIEASDLKEAKRKVKEFLKLPQEEREKVATFYENFYKHEEPVRIKIQIINSGVFSEINEPQNK